MLLMGTKSLISADEILLQMSRQIITELDQTKSSTNWESCIDNCQNGEAMLYHDLKRVIDGLCLAQVKMVSEVFLEAIYSYLHFELYALEHHPELELEYDKFHILTEYLSHIVQNIASNWPDEYELEDIRNGYTEKWICPGTMALDICDLLDLHEQES